LAAERTVQALSNRERLTRRRVRLIVLLIHARQHAQRLRDLLVVLTERRLLRLQRRTGQGGRFIEAAEAAIGGRDRAPHVGGDERLIAEGATHFRGRRLERLEHLQNAVRSDECGNGARHPSGRRHTS